MASPLPNTNTEQATSSIPWVEQPQKFSRTSCPSSTTQTMHQSMKMAFKSSSRKSAGWQSMASPPKTPWTWKQKALPTKPWGFQTCTTANRKTKIWHTLLTTWRKSKNVGLNDPSCQTSGVEATREETTVETTISAAMDVDRENIFYPSKPSTCSTTRTDLPLNNQPSNAPSNATSTAIILSTGSTDPATCETLFTSAGWDSPWWASHSFQGLLVKWEYLFFEFVVTITFSKSITLA